MLTKDSFCRLCGTTVESCEHYKCLAGLNHDWVHHTSEPGNLLRLNEEIEKWKARLWIALAAISALLVPVSFFAVEYFTRPPCQ